MTLKTPVLSRSSLLAPHEQDPSLRLAEAQRLLGDPCYTSLLSWIRNGELRAWRPSGRGHYRVKLSSIKAFLAAHEVHGGPDAQ